MDLHEVAKVIAGAGGGGPGLRLRMGTVTAVPGDGTFSATIAGSTAVVSGIRAFDSLAPVVGDNVVLAVQGADVFGIGHIGAPAGGGVPSGLIARWHGSIATIPAGWVLCDGSNGTPDLRDKFVPGAGASYAVGSTGGEASHVLTVAEMPSHDHGTWTGTQSANHQHDFTSGAMSANASHRHATTIDLQRADAAGSTNAKQGTSSGRYIAAGSTAIDFTSTDHTHSGTTGNDKQTHQHQVTSAGGGGAHNNLPPYYALAYIMKL